MKIVYRVFAALSVLALAFSCQKEFDKVEEIVPVEDVVYLIIKADSPANDEETKTQISGTTPSWSKGDAVRVVYTKTDASIATANSSALGAGSETADFGVSLTSPNTSVNAYAYYPVNAKSATASEATLVIPAAQSPKKTSFDGAADVLISQGFLPTGDAVSVAFKRLGAIMKIKLSNSIINGDKLLNLTVAAKTALDETIPLSGDLAVTLEDGTVSGISNGGNVTATYSEPYQFVLSEGYAYLIVYPQTLVAGTKLVFSGETSGCSFEKEVTLSSDLKLNAGHIRELRVAVQDSGLDIAGKDRSFFEERFTECDGDAGWSGSVAAGSFKTDNASWVTVKPYGGDGSGRFGTSSALGSATTPSITIPSIYRSEDIKLSFKAGAWNGSSESTNLKLSSTNCTLKESDNTVTSVTMSKGAWTNYTLDVTGISGNISISFEGNGSSNSRFFLDDVCVYYGTKPVEKVSPGLAFTPTSATAVIGDTFTEPTLTNSHSVTVYYSSSDESVAEVASNGAITRKTAGTTTITASFYGNASYLAENASYSLTIANPSLSASATTPLKANTADNSTVSFDVTANIAWSASKGTDEDGIIKSVSSVGNTVTVTFNENTSASEKTAKINVLATNRSLAAYDCEVTVTQLGKVAYTITWKANGSTFTTNSAYAGPNLELPDSDPSKTGYVFRGWTLADSVNSDGTGITYAAEGDEVTGAVTYFAVFAESSTEPAYTDETLNGSAVSFAKNSGYCMTTATTASGGWSGTTCYNTSNYIQINSNSNNYYIGSPTFSGDILTVTVNTTNNTVKGRKLFLRSSTTTAQPSSGDLGEGETPNSNGSVAISAEDDTRQFYLYSNGVAYISSIVVRYENGTTTVYSNYTI